jgi:hypothetical protein
MFCCVGVLQCRKTLSTNGWNGALDSDLLIPADLHGAVAPLVPEERQDRDKVNRAVREARDPNAQFVWIYGNGDREKTFRSEHEAETWLTQNDPEGVVFKCRRGPLIPAGSADQYGVPIATE